MICQECKEDKPDVTQRQCGYQLEINGEVVLETICDECEADHLMDI